MKKITLVNNKGGVAKTTSSICLASAFQKLGKRVLLVDCDPQGNASKAYGAVIDGEYTMYDLLKKECSAAEAVQHTDIGDIIPGDPAMNSIHFELTATPGGSMRLRNSLKDLDDSYDICILDTPPDINVFMASALVTADKALIPIQADVFATEGINVIMDEINMIQSDVNEKLELMGIMLTRYDVRNIEDRQTYAEMMQGGENLGYPIIETPVRVDQSIKKSHRNAESIYSPKYKGSHAAEDYMKVAEKIMEVI